jgi:hypothetical protein
VRLGQETPSRTLLGLPDAGFTAPEPAAAAPRSAARRRGLLAAGAGVVVVLIAAAVAVPLLTSPDSPPATGAAPSSSATSAAETTAEVARPQSLDGGDAQADQELWDTLRDAGLADDWCRYVEPAVSAVRSSLECEALDPQLDQPVRYDYHTSPEEAQSAVAESHSRLSGDPGTCDAGGNFLGVQSDRYMACGVLAPTDDSTTSVYVITWTAEDVPITATLVDDDDATAWSWFATNDSQ